MKSPILNSPYFEPKLYFKADERGLTEEIIEGRRPSSFYIPVPRAKTKQKKMELNISEGAFGSELQKENEFINKVRSKIKDWRKNGYQGITKTSRDLLSYWKDDTRENKLFFCQIEALETLIYINEVAEKSGESWIIGELKKASDDANPGLYRLAFKMATGSGKTVVMAMIIAYNTLNKIRYPQDTRFTDTFAIITPGITIRDRLNVLLPNDPKNYYLQRDIVSYQDFDLLQQANVFITNFHQLEQRQNPRFQVGAVIKATGLLKEEAVKESPGAMVNRAFKSILNKQRVLIINDEAHHCYREKPTEEKLAGDDRKEADENNKAARVWLSGLEALSKKMSVNAVIDLSATPYFLRGSGYQEGTMFPWAIYDFSLLDALECGVVKIPRLPVESDTISKDDIPEFRNLWLHVSDELPKKGLKTGGKDYLSANVLPTKLQEALESLYGKEEIENLDLLPSGAKIYRLTHLRSQGESSTIQEFEFEGKKYNPGPNHHWKTSVEGLTRLAEKGRIIKDGNSISYVRFAEDFPVKAINNLWTNTSTGGDYKIYVVQTNTSIIQRCLLMTTDPGDIVLDPTCGSGTTAFVAEQWGRRWITIDTSRVSLALARTRLMTAKFTYYKLKDEHNISAGFEYKTVPHITLKSLANNEPAEQEILYDQPNENKEIVRVSGPFTVESLSPHRVSDAQEMLSSERFVETVVSNLLKSGVQTGEKGARVEFVNLDILPSGPEVQAVGEYKTNEGLKKVAVSIGPEFGSVDDDFIRDATVVAKKFADLLIVAATSFDASAFSENKQLNGLQVMKVKINPDLSMGDLLKKTGSGNLFIAFGEPEVKIKENKDGVTVEVVGVDIYDPVKSEIRSSGSGDPEHEIAAWFIDTNYNGEAFFVTHAYFLGADKPYEKLKKALKADINENAWDELYSTVSRPFPKPKTGKIAVKVINHYGDEVMKIIEIMENSNKK